MNKLDSGTSAGRNINANRDHLSEIDQINDNGESQLIEAVKQGDATAIKYFLDRGADPNFIHGWEGKTALDFARRSQHLNKWDIERLVLAAGGLTMSEVLEAQAYEARFTDPHFDERNQDWRGSIPPSQRVAEPLEPRLVLPIVPIHPIVFNPGFVHDSANNDEKSIKERLKNGESPNSYNKDGQTALTVLFQARNASTQLIARLLAAGAEPNLANIDGQLPLHVAAGKGTLEAVDLLLDYGSEINILDRFGNSPLDLGYRSGKQEVTEILHSNWALTGGELSDRIKESPNPNSNRIETAKPNNAFVKDAEEGNIEAVKTRIRLGASPDSVNDLGDSALLRAVQKRQELMVRLLLESGASPNKADQDQYTPLHEAAGRGNLTMVQCLLEHGAHVNTLSYDITTPLDLCNEEKHAETAIFLRLKGAEYGENVFGDFLKDQNTRHHPPKKELHRDDLEFEKD